MSPGLRIVRKWQREGSNDSRLAELINDELKKVKQESYEAGYSEAHDFQMRMRIMDAMERRS